MDSDTTSQIQSAHSDLSLANESGSQPADAVKAEFTGNEPESAQQPGTNETSNLENKRVLHGVRVGSIGLLIPVSLASEVALTPEICKIPAAPQWISGVTTLRGIAAPVFVIDSFFDHVSAQRGRRAVLLLGQGDAMVGFEIDTLPSRVELGEEEKLLNFPTLPDSVQPFTRACHRNHEGLWIEWDIDGFFRAIAELAKQS